MAETVKSVLEMVTESPSVDVTEIYDRLWALSKELRAKIDARFTYERDPAYADLDTYGGDGTPGGELHPHVGDELDWFVHSWMGDPKNSFTNVHVTAWLGPHIKVPHLGFAFGTLPRLWCYIDFQPRTDLSVDVDSLDRYYEPLNDEWLEMRAREDLDPFVSKALYVRQTISETSFCFSCEGNEDQLTMIADLAHRMVDMWLTWIDEAEPVPLEERAALAERDQTVRRLIAQRDPANELAVSIFGEEMVERLIGGLWGEHRSLPRPHEA